MKKLFALLLFLMVPLAPVGAEGLHGRVLQIVPAGANIDQFEALLATIYGGEVEQVSSLTLDSSALSAFDAVMLFPIDTLPIANQMELINYLKSGGRLYTEGAPFFLNENNGPTDTIPDPEDTLYHFLGLYAQLFDDLEDAYDLFFGVDSEFTRGFSVPHAHDPIDQDVGGTYYPIGNFIPVLFGEETEGGEDDIFAWIPEDTNIHAVMQYHPNFMSGYPAEYYDPFVSLVLCNYFGLCADAVKEAPPAVPAATIRVVSDGVSTSLVVSSEESGTLDIANALGVTVYRTETNSGTSSIELPESLRNGVYFARLQTEHGGQVQPFAIVAK
jgi:hypothetical protein